MKKYIHIFLLLSICLVGCSKKEEQRQAEKAKEVQEVRVEEKQYTGKYVHELTGEFSKKPNFDDVKGMSKNIRDLSVPERYPDEIIIEDDEKAEFIFYQKDEGVEAKYASNIKQFTLAYHKEKEGIVFQFPKSEDETFKYIIKADKRNEQYIKFLDNNAKKIEIDGYYNVYDATKIVDNKDLKLGLTNSIGTATDILTKDGLVSIRKNGDLFIKDIYRRTMIEEKEEFVFDTHMEDKKVREIVKKADTYFYETVQVQDSKEKKETIIVPFNFRQNEQAQGKYEISLDKKGDYQISLYAGDIQIWKKTLSSGALEIMKEEYIDYKEDSSYAKYFKEFEGIWSINMNNFDKSGSLFEFNSTGFKFQILRDGHNDPLVTEHVTYTPLKAVNKLIVSGQRDRGIVSGGTDLGNEKVRYTYTLELVENKKGLKLFDNESGQEVKEEEESIYRNEKQNSISDFTNYIGSWQSDSGSSICTISDDYITSELNRGGRTTLGKIVTKEDSDKGVIIEVEDLPYKQAVIEGMSEDGSKKEYYEDWSFKAKLILSDENKKMRIQILSKTNESLENASMGIEENYYNKLDQATGEINFLKYKYDKRNEE